LAVGFPPIRSVAEQREHGKDAAIVVLAVRQIELAEDRLDVALDGARAEKELLADRAVRAALGDEREDVALAVGQLLERRAAAATDERLHDLRVERGSARGDALDGADELGDVAHAVLQQVADTGRAVAHTPEQLE